MKLLTVLEFVIMSPFITPAPAAALGPVQEDEAVIAEVLLYHLKYFRVTIAHPTAGQPSQWTINAVRTISRRGIAVNFLGVTELYDSITDFNHQHLTHTTAILTRTSAFRECFDKTDLPIRLRISVEDQNRWLSRNHYGWIVLMDNETDFVPEEVLIPFSVPVFLIQPTATAYFRIWEQYHVKNESKRNFFADWSPLSGLNVVDNRLFYHRRSMSGITLKRFVVNDPFGSYSDIIGMHRDILSSFSIIFNFTIEDMDTEDRDLNSDYDLTDQLVLFHSVTPFREKNIGPISHIRINLYYQRLDEHSEENYILRPFTAELWQVLIAWIVIAATCSAIVRANSKKAHFAPILRVFSVFDAFFCQDSDEGNYSGPTERITSLLIWTMVFFIIPAYSSMIFSFMTIRKPYVPFEDIRGFIKDGSYKYGGLLRTLQVNVHRFQPPGSPLAEAAAKFLVNTEELPTSLDHGVRKMCKDKHFAFLGFGNSVLKYGAPCRIQQMREPYFTAMCASQTQKGFPFASAFKEKLPLLHSSGILSIIQKRFDQPLMDEQLDVSLPADVTLTRSVLLLVPAAVLLSLLILALESLNAYQQSVKEFISYYSKQIWSSVTG